MSYKDQSFAARFGALGDEAEGMFERIWPKNFVRIGLNRPPLHMASLPERERHRPDYMLSASYMEVKGIGRDDTVKLKVVEMNCLAFWHQVHPVRIFIWSSHRWAWAVADLPEIQRMIDLEPEVVLDRYHDGRSYFAIPGKLFCWTELDRIDNSEMVDATRN